MTAQPDMSRRATLEAAVKLGLTHDEYEHIVRDPGARAERRRARRCSRSCGASTAATRTREPLLRLLPHQRARASCRVPGENAGVVDIGDGLAVVMKMESHNHPQRRRALPGRGDRRRRHRPRHLHDGRAADRHARLAALRRARRAAQPLPARGRGRRASPRYGNCIGVPTVGGEIYFDDCYAGNSLVNAMCVGLIEQRRDRARQRQRRRATRDARRRRHRPRRHPRRQRPRLGRVRRDAEEQRPDRAGGQPVPREAADRGLPGAARDRATSSACRTWARPASPAPPRDGRPRAASASRSTSTRVPLREAGHDALRDHALRVAGADAGRRRRKGHEDAGAGGLRPLGPALRRSSARSPTTAWCASWTASRWSPTCPLDVLADDRPTYVRRPGAGLVDEAVSRDWTPRPRQPVRPGDATLARRCSPRRTSRSKRWVYRAVRPHGPDQHADLPGAADAAVLRIKGTEQGDRRRHRRQRPLLLPRPAPGRADRGGRGGAQPRPAPAREPLAVTDCLNFGNPEKPEIYYQFERGGRGHGRGLRGARHAGDQRQRQPLQRDQRRGHLPHPGGRDARPARRRRHRTSTTGLPGRGRRGRAARRRPAPDWAARST